MSRNLLSKRCVHCGHDVKLLEEPRPITEEEAGVYFDEFRTMEVANAECPACKAKYLAWVNPPTQGIHAGTTRGEAIDGHYDLSYRSTFNDEPSEEDLPTYEVRKETRWVRINEGQYEFYDLVSHLYRQREFSLETFGPGERVNGVLDHMKKEMREVREDPGDLEEWIDLTLLALDGAYRQGYSPEQVAAALDAKLTENENRDWPDWREQDRDTAIEHSE